MATDASGKKKAESAQACRIRKRKRHQYQEEVVKHNENAVMALRGLVKQMMKWAEKMDSETMSESDKKNMLALHNKFLVSNCYLIQAVENSVASAATDNSLTAVKKEQQDNEGSEASDEINVECNVQGHGIQERTQFANDVPTFNNSSKNLNFYSVAAFQNDSKNTPLQWLNNSLLLRDTMNVAYFHSDPDTVRIFPEHNAQGPGDQQCIQFGSGVATSNNYLKDPGFLSTNALQKWDDSSLSTYFSEY